MGCYVKQGLLGELQNLTLILIQHIAMMGERRCSSLDGLPQRDSLVLVRLGLR